MLILGFIVAALIAMAAWVLRGQRQAKRYPAGRVSGAHGGPAGGIIIAALTPAQEARFGKTWTELKSGFVDDPKGVVVQADRLVRELMLERGYPLADFEQRAAEISVDYPWIVVHYRAAEALKKYCEREGTTTKDLRKAVVHYSNLLEDLLEMIGPEPQGAAEKSFTLAAG
jgi:hypothetical protein